MWDNLSKLAADLDNDINTQLEEEYKEDPTDSAKKPRIRAPETPRVPPVDPVEPAKDLNSRPPRASLAVQVEPVGPEGGATESGNITPEEDGFELVNTETNIPTASKSPPELSEPESEPVDIETRMEVSKLRKAANEAMANAALLEDTIQAKDEELLQSHTALANLQACLEAFQISRDAEAEMHTSDSSKIVKLTTQLEAEQRECAIWRQRYEDTEETSAKQQVELANESHRIKLLEESLLQEKTESRRLSFQLSEIKAKNRRTLRNEDDMLTITAQVSPDEMSSESRNSGTFSVLFEKGPFGAPLWFMFYVMFVHFLAWYFHKRNHAI